MSGLSSGKKFDRPSEAPADDSRVRQVVEQIDRNNGYVELAERGEKHLGATEVVLNQVITQAL